MGTHARRRASSARGERGTTLVELMIYLTISGLFVGAIAASLAIGFRTTGETTVRLAASHDAEIVTNYFPRDVASAAPSGITTTAGATGCAGADTGSNVVRLPSAKGPGDDDQVVAYRLNNGPGALIRFECTLGAAARTIVVADQVAAASATVETGDDGTTTVSLSVTLREPAGHQFEVTGHSRTPTAPVGLPDASVPTTAPALPCKVDSSAATPNPVAIASGTALTTDVAVVVSVSGSCAAPLTVSFTPGSSGSPTVVPLAASGATYVATLDKAALPWTAGIKTLTIGHAGPASMVNPTLDLTVSPPCNLTSVSASPSPVNRQGGKLAQAVTIRVKATGSCNLQISYQPQSTVVTQAMAPSGADWTATIPAGDKWDAGSHPISILGGSSPASVNLAVNP